MAESETYRKGKEIRAKLFGEDAEKLGKTDYADPIMQKFVDMATESVWGTIWTRPGLDLKTKTLVCMVTDAATGREPELALHVKMALRQGWTEDELTEALLHMSGYVGLPLIRGALLTAKKAFAEFRAAR